MDKKIMRVSATLEQVMNEIIDSHEWVVDEKTDARYIKALREAMDILYLYAQN
jgi:hypothetical protein